MDQICLVMPVLPGRASDATDFMGELERDRRDEYSASEQRIGIDKEVWFLASGPQDVSLMAYIEAHDFATALERFSSSQNEFDAWFKSRLAEITGVDLNNHPAISLPRLLSTYTAD